MKKILFSLILSVVSFTFLANFINAASGEAHIHYYNESGADRSLTYTDAKSHLQSMGYSVYGYNNYGIGLLYGHLSNGEIFVAHNHGSPGVQIMKNNNEQITAKTSGDGKINISALSANCMDQMKIAIFYGCKTGLVFNTTGDLPAEVVNKGATAAVAWKVNTYPGSVNTWNRLFFEKAKSDTIVESYRHADYWLEAIEGKNSANIMKNNRNEKGNIYATIY